MSLFNKNKDKNDSFYNADKNEDEEKERRMKEINFPVPPKDPNAEKIREYIKKYGKEEEKTE